MYIDPNTQLYLNIILTSGLKKVSIPLFAPSSVTPRKKNIINTIYGKTAVK